MGLRCHTDRRESGRALLCDACPFPMKRPKQEAFRNGILMEVKIIHVDISQDLIPKNSCIYVTARKENPSAPKGQRYLEIWIKDPKEFRKNLSEWEIFLNKQGVQKTVPSVKPDITTIPAHFCRSKGREEDDPPAGIACGTIRLLLVYAPTPQVLLHCGLFEALPNSQHQVPPRHTNIGLNMEFKP
ncbi:hypothetical protein llap_10094 [Limosa lapponica baueri]|uniref:Uncharacterized protein n=1 Tax=Limosa lapponica baueri TaxID=1758121 RepID=A0A2I0U0M1_LIMLA|nr:hypothetical protein llap_10094 [Limosa lapponica baueri]